MRICSVCKQQKKSGDYYFRDKQAGRLHSQCKACYLVKRKKVWKEYYYRHGSKYRENAVVRNRKLKGELRQKMLVYLTNKSCQNCGIRDPRVLEFDHIDPNIKSISIAKAVSNVWSWDNILEEIKKCQILCANCHKIKTSNEQGWYKAIA